MRAHNDYFIGPFSPANFADYVCALESRAEFVANIEPHAHTLASREQPLYRSYVFARNRKRRQSGDARVEINRRCVWHRVLFIGSYEQADSARVFDLARKN